MYYDKNGYQIHKGDVLKVFHFIGRRNKKYYMYKVVTEDAERLYATNVTSLILDPVRPHRCRLEALGNKEDIEIVQGSGPGP